jgi:hypothetical protein
LIEEIQNQGSNWKICVNIRVGINQIRGQIEELKVCGQLKVNMHKFRTKDQNEEGSQYKG